MPTERLSMRRRDPAPMPPFMHHYARWRARGFKNNGSTGADRSAPRRTRRRQIPTVLICKLELTQFCGFQPICQYNLCRDRNPKPLM
jgi:hypothetical protein